MTKIVNLTPHPLNFIMGDGSEVEIPPSGNVARVSEKVENIGNINGIPVISKSFGEVTGLPEPQPDTIFVVSLLVAQAVKDSRNVVFVIGESVRDEDGHIIGARSLAKV